jgi:hypothetical protein
MNFFMKNATFPFQKKGEKFERPYGGVLAGLPDLTPEMVEREKKNFEKRQAEYAKLLKNKIKTPEEYKKILEEKRKNKG